jgi:hypothetical protein
MISLSRMIREIHEFCDNRLESNILLPNGDLLICCMDYGMEYVFGNLLMNHTKRYLIVKKRTEYGMT